MHEVAQRLRPATLGIHEASKRSGEHDGDGPGAEMVYYEHPGGGIVLSVGSLTFGGSLVVDPTIQQLMRNVLLRAGL